MDLDTMSLEYTMLLKEVQPNEKHFYLAFLVMINSLKLILMKMSFIFLHILKFIQDEISL